jgi:hypothetical protein
MSRKNIAAFLILLVTRPAESSSPAPKQVAPRKPKAESQPQILARLLAVEKSPPIPQERHEPQAHPDR